MDGLVINIKEMIQNGLNSKRKASNNQDAYGAIDMKVMIPGGWREPSNV